jgi:hypothetical protein
MIWEDRELGLRITVVCQRFASNGNPDAEALDEAQELERLGQMRITIIGNPRRAEVFGRYLAEGSAGILNLDTRNDLCKMRLLSGTSMVL